MTKGHKLIKGRQHHGKTGKENRKIPNPDFYYQHFIVDSGNFEKCHSRESPFKCKEFAYPSCGVKSGNLSNR